MHPIPNPAEGVDGTARRRTNNRAVTIVTIEHDGRLHQFGHPRADT